MTTPQKWILFGVVKLAVLAVAVGVVFSMVGCNTVRGVGQDIERAGTSMQRSESSVAKTVGEDVQKVGQSIQKSSEK